jgi:beta-mannosidase
MIRQWLYDNWMLREAPLACTKDQAGWISSQPDGWHKGLSLPCDVHQPLIAAGIIKDPVQADHCFAAEWIEKRSWWFRQLLVPEPGWSDCDTAELVLESLDVHADVIFNGIWIGHQDSAHYPFRADVRPWLKDGENELLVRLTSGLEMVSDADLAELDFAVSTEAGNGCPERGDKRRAFVRKPTYVYGWDWCPRIGTCGIVKRAWIEYHKNLAIRDVLVETRQLRSIDNQTARQTDADLHVVVTIDNLDLLATIDADISVMISHGDDEALAVQTDVLLRSGINYIDFDLTVEQARLWWPNGMGAQDMYLVTVQVTHQGRQIRYPEFQVGIRTVRLDTGRIDAARRRFCLIINDVPVFCKGADWIPADSIYARVTTQKYDTLIREAQQAHFNMLRIWGGGLYEQDAFYEACNRYGILVWQDMMFGCSTYPDHREAFRDLVRREFDHQTRKLRNHACLALFCGNNENHWIYGQRLLNQGLLRQDKQYGLFTANAMMPDIMRQNCPNIPYWNSSPYGGSEPNDPLVGDAHHWREAMMNPDMAKRIDPRVYDQVEAAFVSEYGYPGPASRKSIEAYFAGEPIDRQGKIWQLHTNTFEKKTVAAGISRHYTDRELDLDQYILYAGLVQGLMLGYSLEAMRFKNFCSGALFWMYNDCWGEVGWTIIDYYLRRKIAFYAVRRALMPQKLILRADAGHIVVMGCNDTAQSVTIELETGWIRFDGQEKQSSTMTAILQPYSRDILTRFEASGSMTDGIHYAWPKSQDNEQAMIPALLLDKPYRELALCQPQVSIIREQDDGLDRLVTIKAETFAPGVWLDVDADLHLSDNYFDLLPEETRTVRISGGAGRSFAVKAVEVDAG